jgi:hypothetical protein
MGVCKSDCDPQFLTSGSNTECWGFNCCLLQVTSPVQWETTLKTILGKGLQTSYELGPGKVIAGIVKRIDKKAAPVENISV